MNPDEARVVPWPDESTTPASLEERVARFYEAARLEVYRYLVLRGVEPAAAQDITQDSFLRLYAELLRGAPIRNERAWVFTVAHHLAESWRIAAGRERAAEVEPDIAADTGGTSPELQLIGAERLRRMREAVASLSPQQRQCLHLRAEGFRYREIGEILGIGTSTVSEFLRRAIHRLRTAVGE